VPGAGEKETWASFQQGVAQPLLSWTVHGEDIHLGTLASGRYRCYSLAWRCLVAPNDLPSDVGTDVVCLSRDARMIVRSQLQMNAPCADDRMNVRVGQRSTIRCLAGCRRERRYHGCMTVVSFDVPASALLRTSGKQILLLLQSLNEGVHVRISELPARAENGRPGGEALLWLVHGLFGHLLERRGRGRDRCRLIRTMSGSCDRLCALMGSSDAKASHSSLACKSWGHEPRGQKPSSSGPSHHRPGLDVGPYDESDVLRHGALAIALTGVTYCARVCFYRLCPWRASSFSREHRPHGRAQHCRVQIQRGC